MNISRGKNSLINVTVINSQNYLYFGINTNSSFYIPKNLPYKRKERTDLKSTKLCRLTLRVSEAWENLKRKLGQ